MQQWLPDGVRLERTSWRCEAISARHRAWGFNCPAVDLDFVMAEYNHGKPVALIEYKNHHARTPNLQHATYRALADLADGYNGGPLPFFIAFYCPDQWWFRVLPVNERAARCYRRVCNIPITEQSFVRSLYLLRKRSLTASDEAALAKLNDALPLKRSAA